MNKSKVIGTVGGVILVALSGFGVWKYNAPSPNGPDPSVASAVVKGPLTAKVGDLVVISAEDSNAKSYAWQVYPSTKNFRVDKDGKQAVLSSGGQPGEYLVICAVAKGDTADVKSITVKFTGDIVTDLAAKVQDWASKVSSTTKKDEALKLGQSFTSIASALQSGSVTVQNVLDATKSSNRDALGPGLAAWKDSFLNPLADELAAMQKAGKLSDVAAHIKVWQDIGNALKSYAASL